jgi:probable HAF family extracellular repeat protein
MKMKKVQTGAAALRASRPLRKVLVLAVLSAAAAAHALPTYTCERLRIKADGVDVRPGGINSHGEIAGTVLPDGPPDAIAYRWSRHLGADRLSHRKLQTSARAINDAGQVVGSADRKNGTLAAMTWIDGVELVLPDLPGKHGNSYAVGINNVGQIAGHSISGNQWHAVRWDQGAIVELVDPDDAQLSLAWHINDDGVVVGYRTVDEFSSHATSWDHGVMTDLGVLEGGRRSVASASNRRGLIIGYSTFAGGETWQYHAVAWRDGVITELGPLPGAQESYAEAVNDAGTIVGSSKAFPGSRTAVAWFDGATGPVDLNSLLVEGGCTAANGASVTLESATGVNRHGQIVAYGTVGNSVGFRLTPQP